MKKIIVMIFLGNFFVLQSMEERPRKPMPFLVSDVEQETEQRRQARVLLELLDGNEVIYTAQIPASFAQESSVIRNNLAFQEEEEGQEPHVIFDTKSVSVEQLKVLELFAHEYRLHNTMEDTLSKLAYEWYQNNDLNKLIGLLTISNFIGNEHLYGLCLQKVYKILVQALEEEKWNVFYKIPFLIKVFDMQEDLKSSILGNSTLIDEFQLNKNKKIGKIITNFYAVAPWQQNQWLVVLTTEEFIRPRTIYYATLKTLPNSQVISTFEIPFNSQGLPNPYYFSGLNKLIYVIGGEKINIYDVETGNLVQSIQAHGDENVFSISPSQDNSKLAVALEGKIIVYDINTLTIAKEFKVDGSYHVALTPQGKIIAFPENFYQLQIWDLIKNERIHTLKLGEKESIQEMVFLNEHSLLIATSLGDIKIYNLQTKKVETLLKNPVHGEKYGFSALAISSDKKFLATAFAPRPRRVMGVTNSGIQVTRNIVPLMEIDVWDLQQKSLITRVEGLDKVYSLCFSYDNNKVAFGNGDRYLHEIEFFPFKKLSLLSIILIWGLAEQVKNKQFLKIPEGYENIFLQLPKEIKKYFYKKSLELGQPPTSLPFIYPMYKRSKEPQVEYLKEKRKKPEEKEGGKEKKKSAHKRFKWD